MVQAQDLARLEAMTGYCKTQDCLRGYFLIKKNHGKVFGLVNRAGRV